MAGGHDVVCYLYYLYYCIVVARKFNKSFPFSASTVGWGTGRHPACKTFDVGLLVTTI